MESNDSQRKKLSILQTAQSIFAAAFGVQSSRNRERDFTRGSVRSFIVAGIAGTILFIVTVFTVVKLVLRAVGA